MHIYETEGIYLPSVTTVLHTFIINEDDRLLSWANHLGFSHRDYKAVMNERAAFGTAIHAALQQIMTDNTTDKFSVPGFEIMKFNKAIANFRQFMKDEGLKPEDTLHAEYIMKSTKLGYAGTADWLGSYKNDLTLFDYKTSKKPSLSMYCQLAAYIELIRDVLGLNVKRAAIVLVNEKYCKMYMEDADRLKNAYLPIFTGLLQAFNCLFPEELLAKSAKQEGNELF